MHPTPVCVDFYILRYRTHLVVVCRMFCVATWSERAHGYHNFFLPCPRYRVHVHLAPKPNTPTFYRSSSSTSQKNTLRVCVEETFRDSEQSTFHRHIKDLPDFVAEKNLSIEAVDPSPSVLWHQETSVSNVKHVRRKPYTRMGSGPRDRVSIWAWPGNDTCSQGI